MKLGRRWLWMGLLVVPLLFLGLLLAWAAPGLAGGSAAQEPTTEISLPSITVGGSSGTVGTASAGEAPAAETPQPEPTAASGPGGPAPVPVGGTCIVGTAIDNYGVPLAGWTVTAQHESGAPVLTATTDAYGRFSFTGLGPGTWFLEIQIPAGWKATTSSRFGVTLSGQGDNCALVRFKNERLACVEGYKRDQRGNAGLPGWMLSAEKGDLKVTAVTDGLGYYKLENLEAGTWLLREMIPAGWEPVSPLGGEITLNLAPPYRDGVCVRQDFINRQLAREYGFDVVKRDNKGTPLANWRIRARPSDRPGDELVAITGPDGVAHFRSGVTLGRWTVYEEERPFWKPVGPASGEVTVVSPGIFPSWEFVNEPTTCVEGYKINENHVGLGGWTIQAQKIGTQDPALTTTTDGKGYFRFDDLSLGQWQFSEGVRSGWTPGTVPQFEVDLDRQGSPCYQIRFKNISEPICVEGHKRDENGIGLSGWVVRAQPVDSEGPIKTAITGADGYFRFDGLDARRWRFTEELPLGWVPIEPAQGWQEVDLRSPGPGQCVLISFRNRSPRVCVDVWKKDVHGYMGLPNWEILLRPSGDGQVFSGKTDGTGFLRFSDLMPGWYTLEEVMQSGWASVGLTTRKVNLQPRADGACTPVTFYNRQSRQPYYPPTDPPTGGCRTTHVVTCGQTLSGIAWRYGVSVGQLMAANGLANPNYIWVGQRLCIP
ncbi:MAG: carboxypeptidase regulatory-like domain-containing protein [Anaerolineae bacterium]